MYDILLKQCCFEVCQKDVCQLQRLPEVSAFKTHIQGNSSVGRAAVSKTACRGFEPFFPCQIPCRDGMYSMHNTRYIYGPVVQLVRTPACHAGGRGFEPHPDRHLLSSTCGTCAAVDELYDLPADMWESIYASVAQLVEQGTENPRVVGSIPTGGTSRQGRQQISGADFVQTKMPG